MQAVFGVSVGTLLFVGALVLMSYGAIGLWMQSAKTRADAVASASLLGYIAVVALQSLVADAIAGWAELAFGILVVACSLALCWAVFVAGLSHDAKREQEAVDRIEASIDAANNPEEPEDGTR
jgi:hypothetical protein